MSERSPLTPATGTTTGHVRRFSNEFMASDNDVMSERIASIPSSGSSNWLASLVPESPKKEEEDKHQLPVTPPAVTSALTSPPSTGPVKETPKRASSFADSSCSYNPIPQTAPGASAAVGHDLENSIPLSIFPIAMDKYAICFCGLPGRGKTHISRRMARYLEFFHAFSVQVFNVSEYRRNLYGISKDAEWFDPKNEDAVMKRMKCNDMAINDMIAFLHSAQNAVGVLDCTNHTHDRRKALVNAIRPTGAKILFIEVSNTDARSVEENYRNNVKCSPDYEGIANTEAELDYRRRVDNYQSIFEPIDADLQHPVESKWSYFKCDHFRHHFVVHRVRGHVLLKIVHFIMNMRTTSHAFYLSRHGQSKYNEIGRIGGDSGLSAHGLAYAHKLADFVESHIVREPSNPHSHASSSIDSGSIKSNHDHSKKTPCASINTGSSTKSFAPDAEIPARLWTSNMTRTKETAQFIRQHKMLIPDPDEPDLEIEWMQMKPRVWHHLDELFAGACDGMTYEEIEEQFPEEFVRREKDKLAYRYPRGESYLDVIARLEPIILEMERHREPLLIIAHQGILRIIYAFYMGLSRAEAPYVSVPLNCVLKLTPSAFDCAEQRFVLYTPPKALAPDGQDEPTAPSPSPAHSNKSPTLMSTLQGVADVFRTSVDATISVAKDALSTKSSIHSNTNSANSSNHTSSTHSTIIRKPRSFINPDDPPSH